MKRIILMLILSAVSAHAMENGQPMSLERLCARKIAEHLISDASMDALHADPDNHVTQEIHPMLQDTICSYMPQRWAMHMNVKHNGWGDAVEFLPDGSLIVDMHKNGKDAWIMDVATGTLRTIQCELVNAMAMSSDDRLLVTRSEDKNNALIIKTAAGEVLHTIQQDVKAQSVELSPNGTVLATVSGDHKVRVFNVDTGKALYTFPHGRPVSALALSPDGLLATGSDDGYVRIFNVDTGKTLHKIQYDINHNNGGYNRVIKVAFSPDGAWFATATRQIDGGWAQIFDTATYKAVHSKWHNEHVGSIAFSPDSAWFATGSSAIYPGKVGISNLLTNNFQNAVLIAYLESCAENKRQPNMQGWLLEAFKKHPCKNTLEEKYPALKSRKRTQEDI